MRFPSLTFLVTQALAVLRRFPWTLAAAVTAATASIIASTTGADDAWLRVTFVAMLGLPVTTALTLLAETRGWSGSLRILTQLGAVAGLVAFYHVWRGINLHHEVIRYLQLSTACHAAVAFLPFLGVPESAAFWQYNRRLFLGFLRAAVFSIVLFAGIAVALGALDRLFGVRVVSEVYFRIALIVAFVVNTWIFLAAVPVDLRGLERDTEYPRGLKVFAQYILTPLAFTYLVILIAYLIKIVLGGEWPSGWIGWLVGSVSVTGLLGFLLVHPLRSNADEGWIRTYTRWLFIGLMPAALMLLAAFWKRIVPYGLTEPRTLGLVLGVWLLGIALLYTVRHGAGIRIIPISLAVLLLLTAYGPVSVTHLSISSQGRRLANTLETRSDSAPNAREASAALRFLIDRRAEDEIAARIGRTLPPIDWNSVRYGEARDSLAQRILDLRSVAYVPEYGPWDGRGWIQMGSTDPVAVAGFDWVIPASSGDTSPRVAGSDSVRLLPGTPSAMVRFQAGADTLAFDLRPLIQQYTGAVPSSDRLHADRVRVESRSGNRRAVLSVNQLQGTRYRDSVAVGYWSGWVLLGR